MLAEARLLSKLEVIGVAPEAPSWAAELIHPRIRACLQRYLAQLATFRRPNTVRGARTVLVSFSLWLQEAHPDVSSIADLTRQHIEGWKLYESNRQATQ